MNIFKNLTFVGKERVQLFPAWKDGTVYLSYSNLFSAGLLCASAVSDLLFSLGLCLINVVGRKCETYLCMILWSIVDDVTVSTIA